MVDNHPEAVPEAHEGGPTPTVADPPGLSRRTVLLRAGAGGFGTAGLAALLAACGGGGGDKPTSSATETSTGSVPSASGGTLTIYSVTQAQPGDPFWAVWRKGLKDAGKQFGVKIVDQAPEKFSIQQQVDMFNAALAAKPDGLIAMITDPEAVNDPVKRAIAAGIPVVAVNVSDTRPEQQRLKYLFYVGGNEELSGRRMAERLLRERPIKHAGAATHSPGQIGNELRIKGFRDVLQAQGAKVDKIAINQDPTQSAEILRNYFRRNKDVDAFFSIGPPSATPALQVFKELNLDGKVLHGTFDLSPEQAKAITGGRILATIGQQQYLQGYLPPLFLKLNKEHGFTLASDVDTGPFVIDKSNISPVLAQVDAGYM